MTTDADFVTAPVDRAIENRRSVRAFLDTPVPKETVRRILEVASRAPSGTNTQPWHVHVLTGAARDRLVAAVCKAHDEEADAHHLEYDYYPQEFVEPYLSRRRKVGIDLYSLLKIAKGDRAAMTAQHRKNFEFFGAPVGLMFTLDRRMGKGSFLDFGMFLENIMVAARARGLDTCAQAAWAQFHRVIDAQLGVPPEQMVLCGMALGYADPVAPANFLRSERVTVDEFAVFHEE